MTAQPSLCPSCGAFVRHDWTDTCGRCNAPLIDPVQTSGGGDADTRSLAATTSATLGTVPQEAGFAPKRKLLVVMAGVAILAVLVATTTIALSGPLKSHTEASDTTLAADTTTSTSLRPPTDLGKKFVAGLASSKRLTVDSLPSSNGNVTAAQLAKAPWTHVTDALCECRADFPYNPVQKTNTFDGLTEHMVYATTNSSPIGAGITSLDIGPNVALSDADLKAIAAEFAVQLQAPSVTSSTIQTVDGTRGAVVRAIGVTNVVESVFQHGNMLYIVFAFNVNASDDPLPVYNKLIESFSTSSAV